MGYLNTLNAAVKRWFAGGMIPIRGAKATEGGDGVTIDPLTGGVNMALQSAAVWACCRLLSCAIASLPSHVFEETDDGKQKARSHPLYRYLTRRPNPEMTWFQYLQTTVVHLLLWGNAFTWVDRLGDEVIGLWPLSPERMNVVFGPDGSPLYRYTDALGKPSEYTTSNLMHFRVFSLDGFFGLAPLDYHRLTFDFEQAAALYASGIYKNGGRPSGVLEYPGQLKAEQVNDIRTSWSAMHGVPGRVAILHSGAKYSPVSVPLEQLQFVQAQKFTIEQIARIFGLAPHLIGAGDHPTYASVEQQSLETRAYTIQPIVVSIERTIEAALLEPPYIFRINLNGFERSDIRSRYLAYGIARQWGFKSVNDIRELEDENRIGAQGDIYLSPLNMEPAEVAYTDEPKEEPLK